MTDKLPMGLRVADTKYPKQPCLYRLTMYEIAQRGTTQWAIATLHIRNPGRRSADTATARTYGIKLNGEIITMGLGPHVKQTITVYVTADRVKVLQPLVDLYLKGAAAANEIRDRVSSRRANTILRRGGGLFGGF